MSSFDPSAYGPVIAELLKDSRLNPLGPGSPNEHARKQLDALTPERVFAHATIGDADMARACCAGLWLYHDFLDESHAISQKIETPTGSYWHGIMHRREPDYSNSKYWFRRVGEHPVFEPLRADAHEAAQSADLDGPAAFLATQAAWDPFAFVELCQACAAGRSASEMLCRQIQQREWELLFDFSFRQAVG